MKWVWVCGLWLLVSSCRKAEDHRPEQVGAPTTFEDFTRRAADLICGSRQSCCTESGASFGVEACRADVDEQLWSVYGAFPYDSEMAAACLAQIQSNVTCGRLDDGRNQLSACKHVAHGDTEPGEPCEDELDCAVAEGQVAHCGVFEEGGEQICRRATLVPARRGQEGGACSGDCSEETCLVRGEFSTGPTEYDARRQTLCFREDGLYCAAEVCLPLPALGEPCLLGLDAPCPAGSSCAGYPEGACQEGTVINGEPCLDGTECQSAFCHADELICMTEPTGPDPECAEYD